MSASGKAAFSYVVRVGKVSANPMTVHLSADERECSALAGLWGVSKVSALEAEIRLTRWKRDGIHAKGTVHAELEQPSVVSLAPVALVVDEPVDAVFVPEGSRLARLDPDDGGEVFVDPEGPDAPETFSGDALDVGAIVAEWVSLAIEPYPRLPGEHFDRPEEAADADAEEDNPFAALKNWSGRGDR